MQTLAVLWMLTACTREGGSTTGFRAGVAYEADVAEAKFGIVGKYRPEDGTLQAVTVLKASSTTVSCDDLSFQWVGDSDPRSNAIGKPDRPSSDELAIVVGANNGFDWLPWGGEAKDNPGPSMLAPNAPQEGNWVWVPGAAAVLWRDADCVGGGWQGGAGRIHSEYFMEQLGIGSIFSIDDLPMLLEVGDLHRFELDMGATDPQHTMVGSIDAAYCGNWLLEDRPPLPLVDECQ